MPEIPHLAYPFQIVGSKAVVTEQDSIDEVLDCVEVLLLTTKGSREELPDFGIEDYALTGGPDLNQIARDIAFWEPRADALVSDDSDAVEELIRNVMVKVGTSE